MKKAKYLNLLASMFTLLLVPFLNIYAQTTPFFVMTPNDKEQYIKTDVYWEWGKYTTTKSYHRTSVDDFVVRDGIKFYKGYCISPTIYFGIDESSNKLYFLRDNNKIMMLDFNIPPGSSFVGQLPGIYSTHNISVSGSDSVRTFSYSAPTAQGSGSISYRVERGLGLRQMSYSASISGGRGYSHDFSTINLIRFNQNGDSLYKDQTWAPKISFTPELTTRVFLKSFAVGTTHDMNTLFAGYIPGINFNDSLLIQYFYTNGTDTTATVVKGIGAATPIATLTLQLDSVKMKAGYKFKYRFTLYDKFYRPKMVFHPSSTGYNTLSCDSSLLSSPASQPIPVSFDLKAFPNPVFDNSGGGNRSTTLRFNLPVSGFANGTVYDILGRIVTNIFDAELLAGEYSLRFDTSRLSSGVYVFRLTTKSGTEHIKILVTK